MFTQKEILEEFAELSYLGYNRIGQEEFLWRKREYDAARMRILLQDPSYRAWRNSYQRAVYPRYYLNQKSRPDFRTKKSEYSKKYRATERGRKANLAASKRYAERNKAKVLAYQAKYREMKRRERSNT